ncbi:thiamine-phosphate kinase [Halalkalirubrum salinum]|uniref:thiamine-phosphate kinase n=1 Tax=Halalkalirubrum salinum TaxID=2563889 RepID=UPI0010FB2B6B|nr:thiamine-phosphate kinase [Halalkalirubrum salinum]
MDERTALGLVGSAIEHAGDDAAVVGSTVLTTDMLHETTDFPEGTTRYTAGWRSVGASLSDVAAMGADATAAVAVYADTTFDEQELTAFITGACDVCDAVGGAYVGGDLDEYVEFTVATTAIGDLGDREPVLRSGATPGEHVCVTGTLGRSAAALALFEAGEAEAANELFRFEPRIAAGRTLAEQATAMMDSSDGLARSLHQLAEASDCGFAIDRAAVPVDDRLVELAASNQLNEDESGDGDPWRTAVTFGEDFELVCTLPPEALSVVRDRLDVQMTPIGTVVTADEGVTVDSEPLADKGYTHGR